MDKYRRDLIDVIVAVETEDPRIDKIIGRIKGSFNHNTEYKYNEALRRGKEAQEKREPKPKDKPPDATDEPEKTEASE